LSVADLVFASAQGKLPVIHCSRTRGGNKICRRMQRTDKI